METYFFQQPNSPSSSSWAVAGDTSSSSFPHHLNERRCSEKKGTRVKLSTDPQSVAARERRHRISDRFRVLKSLVPGGTKMDTVSMLEEAVHYVKFLKAQVRLHQAALMVPNLVDPSTYNPTNNSSSISIDTSASSLLLPPPHQTLCNSFPTTSLPPLPFCSLQGDEEMVPHVSFNY